MASRKRLGDLLVEAGLITDEQLRLALLEQTEHNMRLGDVLLARNDITEQQLIEVLEFQLGIPHVKLIRQTIDPKLLDLVPRRLAEQHLLLPLRIQGNRLVVAMSDPLDYYAIEELRMATGYRIQPTIASKDELQRAINRFYGWQENVDQLMLDLQEAESPKPVMDARTDDDSPVAKTVHQIITQAVQIGASDIHFDPQEDHLRIRYRVDGMMRLERTLPIHMQSVIAARIKVMGNMNVAERRLPQDGRLEMEVDFRKVDVRISTLPTIFGEKIVLRILDLGTTLLDLDQIGFSSRNLAAFQQGISRPHGLVFITGPTGSGKTTTLYAAISRLNREDINIVTIEDPVEYHLPHINQMQVNSQIGLTFSRGLRSILRQDPNIIMVGEIRDAETAEIATRAAMTGHLVLSTLHSNHAANSITRLVDMGIEPFLVASSVTTVVSQRLVRKVCPRCSEERSPTPEQRQWFEQYGIPVRALRQGTGCAECGRTGYRGRMAIHEVLTVDDTLRSMILQRRSDHEVEAYARGNGMIPMKGDGLNKAAAGLTTWEEIIRVTALD